MSSLDYIQGTGSGDSISIKLEYILGSALCAPVPIFFVGLVGKARRINWLVKLTISINSIIIRFFVNTLFGKWSCVFQCVTFAIQVLQLSTNK